MADPLRSARDALKDNGCECVIHTRAYKLYPFAMASEVRVPIVIAISSSRTIAPTIANFSSLRLSQNWNWLFSSFALTAVRITRQPLSIVW